MIFHSGFKATLALIAMAAFTLPQVAVSASDEKSSQTEKTERATITPNQSRLEQMRRLYSRECPGQWNQYEYEAVELEKKKRWKGCAKPGDF